MHAFSDFEFMKNIEEGAVAEEHVLEMAGLFFYAERQGAFW